MEPSERLKQLMRECDNAVTVAADEFDDDQYEAFLSKCIELFQMYLDANREVRKALKDFVAKTT